MHHFKLLVFLLILSIGSSVQASTELERKEVYKTVSAQKSTIKILAIGNSFSQDAIEYYLSGLARAEGIKLIIGNLYIGGASLDLHWNNAKEDKAVYQYRKIDIEGNKVNHPETSIAKALDDEEWDYISFQQVSSSSGIYDSYVTPLPLLFEYVKKRAMNKDVKYILHQTWAYSKDSNHKLYGNYENDQMIMFSGIVDAIERAKYLVPIDIVVPAGTAIQNGRTSFLGDTFCRDGYHLERTYGRYTAACAWFERIFGINVIGNSYKPEVLSDQEVDIAQQAAHYAVENPTKITDLTHFKNQTRVAQLFNQFDCYRIVYGF